MVQRRKIIYKDEKVSTTTHKQLLNQPSPQTVNHTLPYFKVESGSEEARISEGYQIEVYFCTRTLRNKESLVTADRTSTFSPDEIVHPLPRSDDMRTIGRWKNLHPGHRHRPTQSNQFGFTV